MLKTQDVWLGDSKTKPGLIKVKSMQWLKILTCYQYRVIHNLCNGNKKFHEKIYEIDKVINHFKKFELSLIGTVNVLKL